ncbi:MAG: recombinase family protein [Gemmatimonadales bacterium]|nr:MAG: recombinase family protein [Gemmatimonadales bacterium]
MNVISYLRVSGQGQVEGDGFDRQAEAIDKFCTANGLCITEILQEEGVSGTIDGLDRPVLSKILTNDCPGQGNPTIVVERLDRLARDLMVQELILKECRERGIKVFSADQAGAVDVASNDGDPTRVLIRQIMGALSQWEKSVIVKKLKAARQRKKDLTGACEGRKRFGSTNLEQKKILLRILEMRDVGFQAQQIKMALDAEGFLTSKGRPMARSFIGMICRRHRGPSGEKLKGREPTMNF